MRSVFVETLQGNKDIALSSREYHHLINVVRLKVGERIVLFNGLGINNLYTVEDINKKNIHLAFHKVYSFKQINNQQSAYISITKKENLDLQLKQLVEIGINNIFLVKTERSAPLNVNMNRVNKIVIQAMEQSNNFIKPNIKEIRFDQFLSNSNNIVYFSSQSYAEAKLPQDVAGFFIGPEGGLSQKEEAALVKELGSYVCHLPTFILRATTATSYCAGYVAHSTC